MSVQKHREKYKENAQKTPIEKSKIHNYAGDGGLKPEKATKSTPSGAGIIL